MNTNPTRVVTGVARLSFANVWEPKSINGSDPKYSVSLIIPKTDTETVKVIEADIEATVQAGIGKFGGKRPPAGALKLPLRDWDTEREDEAYAGHYLLNANSKNPSQGVDACVAPIVDRGEVHSGCYVRVSSNFCAFNTNGNRDVAVGLGNIQKVRDGEPLCEANVSAQSDFGTFSAATDDSLA